MRNRILLTVLVCVLICSATLLSACFNVQGENTETTAPTEAQKSKLSELSEAELLNFLSENGVTVPDELQDRDGLGAFVKKFITDIEADPDSPAPVVNWSVPAQFCDDIRTAVNTYYGTAD